MEIYFLLCLIVFSFLNICSTILIKPRYLWMHIIFIDCDSNLKCLFLAANYLYTLIQAMDYQEYFKTRYWVSRKLCYDFIDRNTKNPNPKTNQKRFSKKWRLHQKFIKKYFFSRRLNLLQIVFFKWWDFCEKLTVISRFRKITP